MIRGRYSFYYLDLENPQYIDNIMAYEFNHCKNLGFSLIFLTLIFY
jgi:hypothetical protein